MRNSTYKTQCWLTVLYVGCLMISNVITNKQVLLPFGITMTAGVWVFPITYILSDIFSEVYGYGWSRTTCYMAFAANLLAAVIFRLTLLAPSPSYWQDQAAFETVLGAVPRVLAASLAAFVVGDFVNDKIFQHMKERGGKFGWRAVVSSLAGEMVDSAIFMPIVFLGQMPIKDLAIMYATEVTVKVLYEIAVLPLTTYLIGVLKNGRDSV